MGTWVSICYQCQHHHHPVFKSLPGWCRVSYTDFTHTHWWCWQEPKARWHLFRLTQTESQVWIMSYYFRFFCKTFAKCVSAVLQKLQYFVAVSLLIQYWYLFVFINCSCLVALSHIQTCSDFPPYLSFKWYTNHCTFTSVKSCNKWLMSFRLLG